ncbi:hypothetical protein NQ318_017365 [Aromia moschata]|uniref:tRNA-splicing endonuclease subunit Sen15 domain-containing protein n=1 Tax=Aromia moschata TaxID=1265417 RepID=A0AAV8Z4J2_9CUCU|nr:hypothetical protein NQ318_017365 [Aromia moschata]
MNKALISEFTKYVDKKEAFITSQVYLEICELKRYFDVTYSFNAALNKITISAKKDKSGPAVSQDTVFLVIVHSDSTCVYYQLTSGLSKPTDATAKHLKENKQEKLDGDIRKNRELIQHAALLGVNVTLKQNQKKETKK